MTVLLCKEPGSQARMWDCGESQFGQPLHGLAKGPACLNEKTDESAALLTYSYVAQQTERVGIQFPPGVGIQLGGSSGYNWIVLFTHYPHHKNLTNGWTAESSMTVRMQEKAGMKQVRTMTFVAYGDVPPRSVATVNGTMVWQEPAFVPFAFNVHSHEHAIIDQLFKTGPDGHQSLVLRQDPIDQRYKPISGIVINTGDRIDWECEFNNTRATVMQVE